MENQKEQNKKLQEEAIALEAAPYVVQSLPKEKRKTPVWARVLIITFTVLIVAYLAGVVYFSTHFSWNTSLNGVNVSGMTVGQAQQALEDRIQDYRLELRERGGKTEYIKGSDIDLEFRLTGSVQDELREQNVFLWFRDGFISEENQIAVEVSYNRNKLYQQIQELDCMQSENITIPVEPQIVKQSGSYVIEDGIEGNKLLEAEVKTVIRQAVENLIVYVDFEAEECYVALQHTPKDIAVLEALDCMNALLDVQISYEFEEDTETLDGEDILDWIVLSEDYEISIDREAAKAYIEGLKEEYEIRGQVIDFPTSYDKEVEVTSYIRSTELDTTLETDLLIEAILELPDSGKKKWVRKASDMVSVGDTYIEINLTSQHLYCYKDGKMILETDIVSGKPSTGCATPPGVYRIRSKSSPAILVGETYRTPVSYWMPFNRGIGLHDATWQRAFGGSRYITQGSHGCINLPLDVAKFIYENYGAGDYVVLYHLEGTENDTATPAGKASSSPVYVPTEAETEDETEAATEAPTTEQPTEASTEAPTEEPTTQPTEAPTEAPTEEPSTQPTEAPIEEGTENTTTE